MQDSLLKFVEEQVRRSKAMQEFSEKNHRTLFESVRKETEYDRANATLASFVVLRLAKIMTAPSKHTAGVQLWRKRFKQPGKYLAKENQISRPRSRRRYVVHL